MLDPLSQQNRAKKERRRPPVNRRQKAKSKGGQIKKPMPSARKLKSVVLLSAGLDSSYNLFKASRDSEVVLALTFDYGQKAAKREILAAGRLAASLGVPHHVISLPWFKDFARSSLVTGKGIPQGDSVKIDDRSASLKSAKSVWVPNRNGILLNIAAGFAESLSADSVIPGFNIEEAQTFPDNTNQFLKTLDSAWEYSTANQVKARCYSTALSKTEIVADGIKIGLPFSELWPCYLDDEEWCGECESCLRFKRALEQNGLSFRKLRSSR